MSSRIRILLVDDHEVVRLGLRTALEVEPDLEIVGEADTVARTLVQAGRLNPDVVLLDVQLPDGSGIEACRELRDSRPSLRVLILTSFGDQTAVLAAMLAGAAGYLLKNAGRADLLKAIRAVASGQTVLDPAVTRDVLKAMTAPATPRTPDRPALSEREREVIKLIADGRTNREIAQTLQISDYTARKPRLEHPRQARPRPPQRSRRLRRPARAGGGIAISYQLSAEAPQPRLLIAVD